jgi:hypothetical protein
MAPCENGVGYSKGYARSGDADAPGKEEGAPETSDAPLPGGVAYALTLEPHPPTRPIERAQRGHHPLLQYAATATTVVTA